MVAFLKAEINLKFHYANSGCQIYLWDREKDKSFLAEAVMEKHSVASAVTVILPSDGSIANAVARIRLEWICEGKQQSVVEIRAFVYRCEK